MLRCLTEKRDELKSEDCRKEVYYFQKMEVSNYHNDVILAAACRADVDKFCKNVQPGMTRTRLVCTVRQTPAISTALC